LLPYFTVNQKIGTEVVAQKLAELERQRELVIVNRYPKKAQQKSRINQTGPIVSTRMDLPGSSVYVNKKFDSIHFFSFDPNTVSFEEMKLLGFSDYVARNIKTYREKGGVFYRPSDLKKIYGFDSILYGKLEPYITLVERKAESPSNIIELNSADTLELMTLKGIGAVFARRIIKYRNSLGGFYSPTQMREVYQFPEETFIRIANQVRVDSSLVRKIRLNFVSFDDLRSHPYIQARLARKIIDYRARKGAFQSLGQLLTDSLLSEEQFLRVSPYLNLANE